MTYSEQFIKALKDRDLEALKKVPKADLHNHSGLGMRFEDFESWVNATSRTDAGEIKIPYPPEKMDGLQAMDAYMGITAQYVSSKEGFEYLLEATIKEAIRDGVVLLETSIDCGWILDYEKASDFFSFIESCLETYKLKIDFRPEIGVFKGISEKMAKRLITPCIMSGLFKSIDFYGEEKWFQPELTKQYVALAREQGLKIKIHTGEFEEDLSVREIYELLKPDALQHGIQAYRDEGLLDILKDKQVPLNICPSSNVVLGAVESIKKHPIRALFDYGVKVTVNTDDLLFFHRSVSEEFLWLYDMEIFTAEELDQIRLNSLGTVPFTSL